MGGERKGKEKPIINGGRTKERRKDIGDSAFARLEPNESFLLTFVLWGFIFRDK